MKNRIGSSSNVEADKNLLEEIRDRLELEGEEELADKLLAKALKLFNEDMEANGSPMTWNQSSNRIKHVYFISAREVLMDETIKSTLKDMGDIPAAQNNVMIGHNSPDMYLFTDRSGKEIFTIHRNIAGDVDITLNAEQTYSEAARAFLQLMFESTAKKNHLTFSRALELMKKDHVICVASSPDYKFMTGAGVKIECYYNNHFLSIEEFAQPLLDFVMQDDWLTIGKDKSAY